MEVQSLTDDELIQQLRIYNIEFGPVIASTRRVYEKKLLSVLEASGVEASFDSFNIDQVDYEEVDDDDEEPVPVPIQTRQTQRSENVRQRPKPPQQQMREDPYEANYSRATRYTSTTTSSSSTYDSTPLPRPPLRADDIVSQASPGPEPAPAQKKGMSIWKQLIIVIVLAVLIFLVIQNMEPANNVPTRSIEQEV